ncbi:MAG: hypothetical protein IPK13_15030 [Deltaproteobacteria bacterium]|nr:hypothetical protein [Deltaproteobacteria bacterium]
MQREVSTILLRTLSVFTLIFAIGTGEAPKAYASSSGPALTVGFVEDQKQAMKDALAVFEAREERLEARQKANARLADRIAELKRRRSRNDYSVDAELSRLLRASVEGERAAASARSALDEARTEVAKTAKAVSGSIRREIAALRPRLASGPASERREAAERILALRRTRTEVAATIERLERRDAGDRTAPLVVSPEPLDGPSDLLEKAEWVEFTRTKLLKKIGEIRRKAEDAERARQLEQDFLAFQTDTTHFDERLHAERVLRQVGAPKSAAGDSGNAAASQTETTAATDTRSDEGAAAQAPSSEASSGAPSDTPSGVYSEPPNLGDFGTGTGSGEPSGGSGGGSGPASETAGGRTPSAPNPMYTPTPIIKDLSADVALGLDTSALGLDAHPSALARLIEALVQLDSKLAQEAKNLRNQARALEQLEGRRQTAQPSPSPSASPSTPDRARPRGGVSSEEKNK